MIFLCSMRVHLCRRVRAPCVCVCVYVCVCVCVCQIGGALCVHRLYRWLRESDALVSAYMLEITVAALRALQLAGPDEAPMGALPLPWQPSAQKHAHTHAFSYIYILTYMHARRAGLRAV
jgi:hypothetical protein